LAGVIVLDASALIATFDEQLARAACKRGLSTP
jgi:hypothetical protein